MCLSDSAKGLVMEELRGEEGKAIMLLQKCHLPLPVVHQKRKLSCSPAVVPDILNRESILASSSNFLKKIPHKNLKTTNS